MRSIRISLVVGLIVCAIASEAVGQQFKAGRFTVEGSRFVTLVKDLRASNPKITPAALAEAANSILDKTGMPYAVSFDAATCERLGKIKAAQKDPNAPLALGATLKSVDAEGASLSLPEPVFAPGDCGCYVELPLLQVTDKDFIAIVSGRNIKFHLPSNLNTYEAVLLDGKDRMTVKRRWRIPFRGLPIGVSHDENVLYLGFEDPALGDLSLAVFVEGVFQVATRAEAEEGGKGKLLEPHGLDRLVKFDRWGNTYLVKFRDACSEEALSSLCDEKSFVNPTLSPREAENDLTR